MKTVIFLKLEIENYDLKQVSQMFIIFFLININRFINNNRKLII